MLNKFFAELDDLGNLPTASAYSQAREKLKPEVFKGLNKIVVDTFYDDYPEDEEVLKWNGKLLLAVDGSKIHVFDTPETRETFTVERNQFVEHVRGLGSFLYDVENEIIINVELSKQKSEASFIAENHINYIMPNSIILLDMGYNDYTTMALLISKKVDFVIRFPVSSKYTEVKKFVESEESSKVIELSVTESQKKLVKKYNLSTKIKVRFVKVVLDNGQTEILGTTLMDASISDLKYLYWKRWGIETYFDRFKNIFEVERFSGKKVQTIMQDFYGMVYLSNMESLLIKETNEELKSRNHLKKYTYKVNHSVSYSAMLDYLIDLFYKKASDEEIYQKMKIIFKTNPVVERPGRKFTREKRRHSTRLAYVSYNKRVIS